MRPTSEMNSKELTAEAQNLSRLAGHARLHGEGHVASPHELQKLREVVDEARAFEAKTSALREAAAASLAKLRSVKLDPATAKLLDASAAEAKAAPGSEGSLFAVVARCRAWPPEGMPDAKFSPVVVAERLSVKTRKRLTKDGPLISAWAFGVSRQRVYRGLEVAKKLGISIAS